ncbi:MULTISPECIES: fructose PTS transporter subunit IIA [Aliivibrio]|uniref:fructose PTS transporter subunit IIA n=1 Tax=Aliivibrio TaxID=511678 RepID=UPI00080DCBAF|nr:MULTISPECIES: fructose PTS transporter subunit IIA [Aliivibrio]MBD1568678.1 PTS transporter subunit EIIA [Aliivibrio sp. S10_S31]OCH33074.1 PTS glucose transporter subunit IIA [Aliivibrio fischeri]OCH59176.1 PTS glucose transporter subunit IIA [Aliivibrio fischeri]USR94639.1 fructose PTS transporter subunit IIA [Aliivibrio fischeri ATCC 7744 = JCM 18803 = DSM 507]GGK28412.1 hypothetical protein GCM10007987_10200 [Aliivibrio fischeri]
MKLAQLTSPDLILIDAVFDDRLSAIHALTDKLDLHGKLTNKQEFLEAVLTREEEGPTALGEYLAVPHGKSEAVKAPVFACAFVKEELMWTGLDGDEPVKMIFLLAIPPAEAGSTHMEVLTTLTSLLVEDDFREQLLAASSTQEVMSLFDGNEDSKNYEQSKKEIDVQVEIAKDTTRYAYPAVLGIGVLISVFLFMLL